MSQTSDQIRNHLEFLGFKIESEPLLANPKEMFYTAVPANGYKVQFWEVGSDFVRFRCLVNAQAKVSDMLNAFVNDANRSLVISSLYYDNQEAPSAVTLVITAVYMGTYVRTTFGAFIDSFRGDLDRVGQVKNYQELFFGKN
jgi:hypothetical protein